VVCASIEDARQALARLPTPVVVKASGLAAGKGVLICSTREEAETAAAGMFSGTLLGQRETEIVLEEFLTGEEISFFALCDGQSAVTIAAAQDHKRVGEGDIGPNTGGMGAYSTDSLLDAETAQWIAANIAQRTVDGMRAEGNPFKGILFIGLMMTAEGPKVLEFNTRWGDPETEAIVLRLETDMLDLFQAAIDGTARSLDIRLKPGASATVIAASGGYPGKYVSGRVIHGIDLSTDTSQDGVVIFHAGTALRDGQLVTAGGRVLAVSAVAADLRTALERIYARLGSIRFEGMHYRRDIGQRALGGR
jgi:phosphoribosylamine--glycine ligase